MALSVQLLGRPVVRFGEAEGAHLISRDSRIHAREPRVRVTDFTPDPRLTVR